MIQGVQPIPPASSTPVRVMEVLFLCPWLPWPLNSGGKLRTFNLIRSVAPWARVHLRAVLEPDQGQADVDALAPYCASLKAFPREAAGPLMRLTHSKMERWFHSPALIRAVRAELESEDFDLVHIDELLHARILPPLESGRRRPPVVQHHHKLDLAFAQSNTEISGLERRFDAWKIGRLERESADRHQHHLLCSRDDADTLCGRYPTLECSVLPSGYDPDYFRVPVEPPRRSENALCFIGSMDYLPNVAAMTHFVTHVLPRIRAQRPEVRLTIVGRNPSEHVRGLAADEAVEVTGGVPDVRPWLSRSAAMVVPLTIGGGTRLKIVEAMAMECPVISTTIGAEGLGMQDGRELLLADGDQAFAEATLKTLAERQATQARAQVAADYVRANLTWSRLAERLAWVWREVSGLG